MSKSTFNDSSVGTVGSRVVAYSRQYERTNERKGTSYPTLSYTCGDNTKSHTITCDGQQVGISSNLHNALWYLRHPKKTRILWTDAICIDQPPVIRDMDSIELCVFFM